MNDLQILTSHLVLPMLIAILYIGWILRALSRRLGEVTRMKPYYYWFYVGETFIALAMFGYTLYNNASLRGKPGWLIKPSVTLLVFHLPLALGIMINSVVTLIYWGWLIRKH